MLPFSEGDCLGILTLMLILSWDGDIFVSYLKWWWCDDAKLLFENGEKFVDAQLPAMMFCVCVYSTWLCFITWQVSNGITVCVCVCVCRLHLARMYMLMHQLLQSDTTWKELTHQQRFTNQSPKKGSFAWSFECFFPFLSLLTEQPQK